MDPELAKITIQFMQRVQLTGQEVPAFNAVVRELERATNPEPPPPTNGELDSNGHLLQDSGE